VAINRKIQRGIADNLWLSRNIKNHFTSSSLVQSMWETITGDLVSDQKAKCGLPV